MFSLEKTFHVRAGLGVFFLMKRTLLLVSIACVMASLCASLMLVVAIKELVQWPKPLVKRISMVFFLWLIFGRNLGFG